jgi:hypothetical protein
MNEKRLYTIASLPETDVRAVRIGGDINELQQSGEPRKAVVQA